jgi:hypothetical protein
LPKCIEIMEWKGINKRRLIGIIEYLKQEISK